MGRVRGARRLYWKQYTSGLRPAQRQALPFHLVHPYWRMPYWRSVLFTPTLAHAWLQLRPTWPHLLQCYGGACLLAPCCRAMRCWTVVELEELGASRSLGHRTRHQVYDEVSSLRHIPLIRTPTLFLNSEDDPFLGWVLRCRRGLLTGLLLAVRLIAGNDQFTSNLYWHKAHRAVARKGIRVNKKSDRTEIFKLVNCLQVPASMILSIKVH